LSWIPDFEIGIWNAWIFIIWPIVINILGRFIFKEKNISGRPRISVPRKFEKILRSHFKTLSALFSAV